MKDELFFYLNGRPLSVRGPDAFETLANFVRLRTGATGTKLVCEEGDCGACTVLIGKPDGESIRYEPVNSCIQFVFQIAGAHVVTVEGLRRGRELHPVQEAMVRCHGAQCGFCTPGFVVALCAMFEKDRNGDERQFGEKEVRDALTGNLCRCTGYEPILKAAIDVDRATVARVNALYPDSAMVGGLREHAGESLLIESEGRTIFLPATIGEAVAFKGEHPECVIVQGATDVGVLYNKRGLRPPVIMNLSRIAELAGLSIANDDLKGSGRELRIGATVTLTRLETAIRELFPELYAILFLFGAPQIRNAGTLAGNIANGSPIADTLPFLFVMNATIELTGPAGTRPVQVDSLYLGYRKLDIRPDEIITAIVIPLPVPGNNQEVLELYKITKRKNLDISTVTAAFRIGFSKGVISNPRVAFGGVGPTVVRLPETETFLQGKQFSRETFRAAGAIARNEIRPISDVRGSAGFRRELTANLFMKFYFDIAGRENAPGDSPSGSEQWAS